LRNSKRSQGPNIALASRRTEIHATGGSSGIRVHSCRRDPTLVCGLAPTNRSGSEEQRGGIMLSDGLSDPGFVPISDPAPTPGTGWAPPPHATDLQDKGSFGPTISSEPGRSCPVSTFAAPRAKEAGCNRAAVLLTRHGQSPRAGCEGISVSRPPRHSRSDGQSKLVIGTPDSLGGRPPRRPPVCPISAITLAVPWSHPKHHQRCIGL
jgi:hypothetical protein